MGKYHISVLATSNPDIYSFLNNELNYRHDQGYDFIQIFSVDDPSIGENGKVYYLIFKEH